MLVLAVAALVAVVAGVLAAVGTRLWTRRRARTWVHRRVAAGEADAAEEVPDVRAPPESERATVAGLSAAALAVAACVALVGILFVLVRSRTGFDQLDLGPARWAARNDTATSTSVLRILTHLGSTAFALPLVVVVGAVESRRVPDRSIPGFLLLVEGGQLLLVNVVKVLVGRARPDIDQLAGVSSPSFPSGHAATAAATFAALVLLVGRRRSPAARVAMAGAAAGLTAVVATSRVLLGVHWLTDVLAGAALGWGWAALCSMAYGGRLLRFGAPFERDPSSDGPASPTPRLRPEGP